MDRGFSGLGFNQGVRRVRFRLSWVLSRATFGILLCISFYALGSRKEL